MQEKKPILIKMKNLFFLLALLSFQNCFGYMLPRDYSKNNHVKISCEIISGNYIIHYTFKDNFEKLRTFTMTMPVDQTIKDISKFGVPKWMFKPYPYVKSVIRKRNRIIKKGMFKTVGNILKPDYTVVAETYSIYTKSIASQFIQLLIKEKADSRTNRIEMAMKFVQDIPYGIPEISDSTWETGGMFTPPEVLIRMYGDCDSKAIFFVSLLENLIDSGDLLMLFTSDKHALTAIKGIPVKGQVYILVNGINYIIADTSGPQRLNWGDDGNKNFDVTGYKIETIKTIQKGNL